MLQTILKAYGFQPDDFTIEPFGSGLINQTWKVSGEKDIYIIQQINKRVFKDPESIADNLQKLDSYLKATAPEYLFVAPVRAMNG
jgi:hypothetical protein